MADHMMDKGRIGKQIVLPFRRAVEISIKSLKIRFWRSLITVSSIILAIAFLASILVTTSLVRQLHVGPERQLESLIPQRDKLYALQHAHFLHTLPENVQQFEARLGIYAGEAQSVYEARLRTLEAEKAASENRMNEMIERRDNLAKLNEIQFVLELQNKFFLPVPRSLHNMKAVLSSSLETLEESLELTRADISDAHREALDKIRDVQQQSRERTAQLQSTRDNLAELVRMKGLDKLYAHQFVPGMRLSENIRERAGDVVQKLEQKTGVSRNDADAAYALILEDIRNQRAESDQRLKELTARRDSVRRLQSMYRALDNYSRNEDKLAQYAAKARELEQLIGVTGREAEAAHAEFLEAIDSERQAAAARITGMTAEADEYKVLHERYSMLNELTSQRFTELASTIDQLEREMGVGREDASTAYEDMRSLVDRERRLADNIRLLLAREGGGEEIGGKAEETGDEASGATARVEARRFTFFAQLGPRDYWLISLALLVCFVGIVNAMLMSVTERFREIGTMKCLGALDSFIVKLFLLESVFQGTVGTLIGIIVGTLLSIVRAYLVYGGIIFRFFPIGGVITAMLIAQAAGIFLSVIASVFPARAAARMQPVDALRSEE